MKKTLAFSLSKRIIFWIIVVIAVASFPAVECSRSAANDVARRSPCNRAATTKKLPTKPLQTGAALIRGGQDSSSSLSVPTAVVAGMLLAFNSGFINGSCLSGGVAMDKTKQAVAAVTGAYTTSAIGLADKNFDQFRSQVGIILSFISGSTIAGMLNPRPVTFELSASCGPAFLIGSLLLFVSSSMAAKDSSTKTFFYLAAVANGIQNSITSAHTANLIRTTHYTGISSDIGTFLGQALRGNCQNLWKLKVFVALALSFWLGGFVSYFATAKFASSTLLFSACLYLFIGGGLFLHKLLQSSQASSVPAYEPEYMVKVE